MIKMIKKIKSKVNHLLSFYNDYSPILKLSIDSCLLLIVQYFIYFKLLKLSVIVSLIFSLIGILAYFLYKLLLPIKSSEYPKTITLNNQLTENSAKEHTMNARYEKFTNDSINQLQISQPNQFNTRIMNNKHVTFDDNINVVEYSIDQYSGNKRLPEPITFEQESIDSNHEIEIEINRTEDI